MLGRSSRTLGQSKGSLIFPCKDAFGLHTAEKLLQSKYDDNEKSCYAVATRLLKEWPKLDEDRRRVLINGLNEGKWNNSIDKIK